MWFTAAWFSWQPAGTLNTIMMSSLGLLGLAAPAAIVGVLFLKNPELKKDFVSSFVGFMCIKTPALLACFFLLHCSLLLATALIVSVVIFGVYWTLWHLLHGCIHGYYQNEVASDGFLFVANFVLSLFTYVLLSNYLYFRTKRNIIFAIVFHLSANIGNEMFDTRPDSKIIQTGIPVIICIALLVTQKDFFFKKELTENCADAII